MPTLTTDRKKPNIIIILADDLGYGDLGCYGGRKLTPNIDRLAGRGAQFRNFYVGAPMCSPSRAAILSGRYPCKVGIPGVIFQEHKNGLLGEVTIADTLRSCDYHTGAVGKWHLGHDQVLYSPGWHGFNSFRGIPYSNNMSPLPDMDGETVVDDLTDKKAELTLHFKELAIDFIKQALSAQPYFLYCAFTAPHAPLLPSPDFQGISGQGLRADTLCELDWAVGEIVEVVQARDQELGTETLILFLSDNGADMDSNLPETEKGSNGPFRGGKFSTLEGGIRVPLIAYMKGIIPEGRIVSTPISAMDLKPTLGTLGGSNVWQIGETDGQNVWPVFTGESDHIERELPLLHFRFDVLECATHGKFKIRFIGGGAEPNDSILYDIESDPGERLNVATQYPEIVDEMMRGTRSVLSTFMPGTVRSNLL